MESVGKEIAKVGGRLAEDFKQPPQDIKLERAILGAILIDKNVIQKVAGWIDANVFYKEDHQIIYQACLEQHKKGYPIDLITINDRLRKMGSDIPVMELISLADEVCSSANIEYWALLLVEQFMKRELIQLGGGMHKTGYDETEDILTAYSEYAKKISNIQEEVMPDKSYNAASIAREIMDSFDNSADIIPSFFNDIPGFFTGDLYIIAARPGMGKTSLICDIAKRQAKAGIPVGFFSLEMERKKLFARILSADIEINSFKLQHRHLLEDWEKSKFHEALNSFNLPLCINDTGGMDIEALVHSATKLIRSQGVKIVFIDYLQLLSGGKKSEKRNENRDQELGRITRRLKAFAKEMHVPVILLSQLSRQNEKEKKKPTLSALRESGSIEQDADRVDFIYRPEYYEILEDGNGISTKGMAELITAKNRNGGLGSVNLRFEAKYSSFSDFDPIKNIQHKAIDNYHERDAF